MYCFFFETPNLFIIEIISLSILLRDTCIDEYIVGRTTNIVTTTAATFEVVHNSNNSITAIVGIALMIDTRTPTIYLLILEKLTSIAKQVPNKKDIANAIKLLPIVHIKLIQNLPLPKAINNLSKCLNLAFSSS